MPVLGKQEGQVPFRLLRDRRPQNPSGAWPVRPTPAPSSRRYPRETHVLSAAPKPFGARVDTEYCRRTAGHEEGALEMQDDRLVQKKPLRASRQLGGQSLRAPWPQPPRRTTLWRCGRSQERRYSRSSRLLSRGTSYSGRARRSFRSLRCASWAQYSLSLISGGSESPDASHEAAAVIADAPIFQ